MVRIRKSPKPQASRIEPLEMRLLLAGDVAVSAVNSTLLLTGDGDNNYVVIDQNGLGPDQYRISSGDGTTTVNGSLAPLVVTNGFLDIRATMGAGDDRIDFNTVVIDRNVFINGQTGNNAVAIANSSITGSLSILNASGDDTNTLTDTFIGRNVVIRNAVGSAVNTFNGDGLAIVGSVAVLGGPGANTFNVGESPIIGGNLTINSGSGVSDVNLGGIVVNRSVFIVNRGNSQAVTASAADIFGSIRVITIGGDSIFSLADQTHVRGSVSSSTVGGAGVFFLTDSQVDRSVSIFTGLGNSTTIIDASTVGNFDPAGGLFSRDVVSVVTRGQQNIFAVNDSLINATLSYRETPGGISAGIGPAMTSRGFSLNGTAVGATITTATVTSTTVRGALVMIVTGPNLISLGGDNIQGTTRIFTGSFSDAIAINDSTFAGFVSINTGTGADTLSIETGPGPATTVFNGPVNVFMGNDNDLLESGVAASASQSVTYSSFVVFNGGSGANVLSAPDDANTFLVTPRVLNFAPPAVT
jgi:hypothetical protein